MTPIGVINNKIDATKNNVLLKNSNVLISKADRVQLAQTIKEMLATEPKESAVSNLTTEDIVGLLSTSTNPGVVSNAAGIILAAKSGNKGALAGHVVGLLGLTIPAATATPAPGAAAPMAPPMASPVVAPMAPSADLSSSV